MINHLRRHRRPETAPQAWLPLSAAARTGARTLLIEQGPCLGEGATLRSVVTNCGLYAREDRRHVVFGVAEEMLAALRSVNAVNAPLRTRRQHTGGHARQG